MTKKHDSAMDRLLDDLYESLLQLFPEFATRAGDHRFDDRLGDPGPQGRAAYESTVRRFLARIRKIDPALLGPRRRTDLELARLWLETEAEGFPFHFGFLLVDQLQGFQIILPNIVGDMPYDTEYDYGNAIARVEGIPTYVDRLIEGTREGLRSGIRQALPAVEKVLAQIDLQLAMAPADHPFFQPFRRFPDGIPGGAQGRIRTEALAAIGRSALPALRRFAGHLRSEYLPKARREAGIWSLPRGREIYAWLARQSTTTALSPEEIHRIGLTEVERIRSEMEAVKGSTGFQGSLEEFFLFLRSEPRFYHGTAADLVTGYRDISKRVDAELPRFFGRLPRTPYGVVPIPAFAAASNTSAYYQPPPAGGLRPGLFFANTHDLRSRPRYEMEALTLHEAVPGHHLQLALQIEMEDLPRFRTLWLGFTAYVEGWALYCERLGKEMGFYTDPYSEFGRLTFEIWRAARLVVDTGIHHMEWTREQAISYLLATSGLARLNIESEVDRYIAWPAQALAYKIGELRIRDLRRRAEEALGPAFDLRAFHDRILQDGSLPLDLLDQRVAAWIRRGRGAGPGSTPPRRGRQKG